MYLFKIGGPAGLMETENLDNFLNNFLKDFAKIPGKKILIHGASSLRDETALKMGFKTEKITSVSGVESVKTDKNAMDMIMMAYSGLVNKRIVEKLQKLNVNAVGLSGIDGALLRADRKKAIKSKQNGKIKVIKDDLSGKVHSCNTKLLNLLLDNDYTPVICIPVLSEEGQAINTDNDTMTAVIAKEMKIDTVVYFSDVPGLLKNFPDENSLIKEVKFHEIDDVMESAKSRMKRKVLGAKDCLENGVSKVIFADARLENPIKKALEDNGTVFIKI